jgi:hypothetical protein
MGLWPTYGYESALLGFIDSEQVTRDFRRSDSRLAFRRGVFLLETYGIYLIDPGHSSL